MWFSFFVYIKKRVFLTITKDAIDILPAFLRYYAFVYGIHDTRTAVSF